jgi:hypothetical protein
MYSYDDRLSETITARCEIERWLTIQLAPAHTDAAPNPELMLDASRGSTDRLRLVESVLDTNAMLRSAARRLPVIDQLELNLELIGGVGPAMTPLSGDIRRIGTVGAPTRCFAQRRARPR